MQRKPKQSADQPAAVSGLLDLPLKWLIPSVAVLFAVVGYIVQSAQESLLGVATADHGNAAYFNAAADFLRESIVRLLSWPWAWLEHPHLHRPLLLFYAMLAIALAIVAIYHPRVHDRIGFDRALLAAAALVGSVVILKFLLMDGPLLKIENLAVRSDQSCWALVVEADGAPPRACPQRDMARAADAVIWSQASEIVGEIVCSRVPIDTARLLPAAIADSRACSRRAKKPRDSQAALDRNKQALSDEFLANLFLSILTITAAVMIMRRPAAWHGITAVCVFVMLYGLTTPYSYGKVGMTQQFDIGEARITEDLQKSYGSADKNILFDQSTLSGVLLQRSAAGVTILWMRYDTCPPAFGKPRVQHARATQSFISASRLMSLDEIYKVDLIYWLATNQRNCR